MFYVYILLLSSNTYYTGQTNNFTRRIKQHQSGLCISTQDHLPFKVVYTKKLHTRKKALKLEKYIKRNGAHRFLLAQRFGTTIVYCGNENPFAI